jgi:erythromycin esterase
VTSMVRETRETRDTNVRVNRIRAAALPLTGPGSFDPLLERIGDARYVLLGEASHGTAEFYRWRAELTRRLIEERGFSFVAVEGDWPDCLAVHRSVTAAPDAPADPADALAGFERWPAWMWANTDVRDFVRRLRAYNTARTEPPVGFFGLDVYSLWESLHAVLGHLREHDPDAAEHAEAAYRCFEPYAEDPQDYARATRLVPSGCEPEVLALLRRIRAAGGEQAAAREEGLAGFTARQHAEVLAGAERYYRAMIRGGPESWNIRDTHMADTLDRLTEYHGPQAKAVVWEHNTHVGDARATDMADAGLVNVGQLVRERHAPEGVVLVGFGSYEGTVTAAEEWGARPRVTALPPARAGSTESLLHRALPGSSALFVFPPVAGLARPADEAERGPDWLSEDRDHRAVGVVYQPERERWGNYVSTVLGARYDAFVYVDHSTALSPLRPAGGAAGEEETWPWGL